MESSRPAQGSSTAAAALLDEALEAHGGMERWRGASTIRAHVRSGGLLIRTRVPGTRFADYELTVDVAEPRAVLDPFPREGQRGVFDNGEARIESQVGETIDSRADPRPAFFGRLGLRRNLRWDALDSAYFAGYAMWNYATSPYLLTREGGRAHRGRRARLPHPPPGAADRPTQPLAAVPDPGVDRAGRHLR
jgi:hypothetical protein